MGIELHKVDTERESERSERELALDWIRRQRGEKQGKEGRLLFAVQSTLKAGPRRGESWNGAALTERGGNGEQKEKKTYAFPPVVTRNNLS